MLSAFRHKLWKVSKQSDPGFLRSLPFHLDIILVFVPGLAGETSENVRKQLAVTFAFSQTAPPDNFRKLSVVQCMSERSNTLGYTLPL